jgi:hypothetical protein
MSSLKIQNPATPATSAYIDRKKQKVQSSTAVAEDVVSLSSASRTTPQTTSNLPRSQSVTTEEKQALTSIFSVFA